MEGKEESFRNDMGARIRNKLTMKPTNDISWLAPSPPLPHISLIVRSALVVASPASCFHIQPTTSTRERIDFPNFIQKQL